MKAWDDGMDVQQPWAQLSDLSILCVLDPQNSFRKVDEEAERKLT